MCIFFFFFGSALAIHINKREIIGKFHVKTKFVLENIFKHIYQTPTKALNTMAVDVIPHIILFEVIIILFFKKIIIIRIDGP